MGSSYVYLRGRQALTAAPRWRPRYALAFWFLTTAFILGRVLERFWPSTVSDLLVWAGAFWLGALFYFLQVCVALDVVRIVARALGVWGRVAGRSYGRLKLAVMAVATAAIAVLVTLGYLNALRPRLNELHLTIDKPLHGATALSIAAVSDIHLGTLVGRARAEDLVRRINELKPDLVLLVGDIVDEDLGPVIRENVAAALSRIQAPLGVFAITGNHEYIGGAEAACRYLQDQGITMLRDTVVQLANGLYLVGREDRSRRSFTGRSRQPLEHLMVSVDRKYPIILLDHQPFDLEAGAEAGVDLQLSGHTHDGQLWPINLITDLIYEKSCGYLRKGATQIYVSSGFGTWGPPVRIGNRPEILSLQLSFQPAFSTTGR